jgi:hypothetical protein
VQAKQQEQQLPTQIQEPREKIRLLEPIYRATAAGIAVHGQKLGDSISFVLVSTVHVLKKRLGYPSRSTTVRIKKNQSRFIFGCSVENSKFPLDLPGCLPNRLNISAEYSSIQ